MSYKYQAIKTFSIIYSIMLFVCVVLTGAKWLSIVDTHFVLGNSEINTHIFNFSLSIIIYLGIGYRWLLLGNNFLSIKILGIFLIFANILCETVMGFMNTCDIIDAVYGIFGVSITYLYLFLLKKYGLTQTKQKDDS